MADNIKEGDEGESRLDILTRLDGCHIGFKATWHAFRRTMTRQRYDVRTV